MGGSKMIKLKKLIKEASLSPSYNKMYREWTVLQVVLGTVSEEYKKIVHDSVFKKWWDALHRGEPEAIKLFPKVAAKVDSLMKQRIKKIEKGVVEDKKRITQGMAKFMKMGKGLKV